MNACCEPSLRSNLYCEPRRSNLYCEPPVRNNPPPRRVLRKIAAIFSRLILAAALLCAGCQPAAGSISPTPSPLSARPLETSGTGAASLSLGPWQGTAVLRISAGEGAQPFRLVVKEGLDRPVLLEQAGPLDEYRAWTFASGAPVAVDVQGDAAWSIRLLPPTAEYFPVVQVPGAYQAEGSAVILLEGEHSIAIFDAPDLEDFTAWAYPREGQGEQLAFRTSGDFRGRAVLPKNAAWLLIITRQGWSVEVQIPCCEKAPG